MITFVQKRGGVAIIIPPQGTARLDDGTGIPHANLPFYTPQELAAFSIFSFEPPVPPPGQIVSSITYEVTPEGIDQVPEFENAPPAPEPIPVMKNYGIARFTVTAGAVATTSDSIKIASVLRVSAGRYRVYHLDSDPDRRLIPTVAILDAADRRVRITARTASYTEIRVVDGAAAAADASDVTLRLDRIELQ